MNPTPPDAEKELDEILALIDSHLALDGEPYIPDEIIVEAKRRLLALMDAARKDENERWFQECKNVMSHAIYAARFRDRQYELSHPAPVHKSDKE